MKLRANSQAGFTLLEAMFAAGVLSLALSMLFGSLLTINVIGQLSESRTQAACELASLLEEARTMSIGELINYVPPELHGPGIDQSVQLEYIDGSGNAVPLPLAPEEESGEAKVPAGLPNPLEIRATYAWTDENGRVYGMSAATRHGR